MNSERYELTRSIIHKCPAVKLPQTFVQRLGMTAQIMPLKGYSDEQAQTLVDKLNRGDLTAQIVQTASGLAGVSVGGQLDPVFTTGRQIDSMDDLLNALGVNTVDGGKQQ